jgi:hypothetical protein
MRNLVISIERSSVTDQLAGVLLFLPQNEYRFPFPIYSKRSRAARITR